MNQTSTVVYARQTKDGQLARNVVPVHRLYGEQFLIRQVEGGWDIGTLAAWGSHGTAVTMEFDTRDGNVLLLPLHQIVELVSLDPPRTLPEACAALAGLANGDGGLVGTELLIEVPGKGRFVITASEFARW